jgi:hypothetical protein
LVCSRVGWVGGVKYDGVNVLTVYTSPGLLGKPVKLSRDEATELRTCWAREAAGSWGWSLGGLVLCGQGQPGSAPVLMVYTTFLML